MTTAKPKRPRIIWTPNASEGFTATLVKPFPYTFAIGVVHRVPAEVEEGEAPGFVYFWSLDLVPSKYAVKPRQGRVKTATAAKRNLARCLDRFLDALQLGPLTTTGD